MAKAAAVAALWLVIMNTGSIRHEAKATWLAESANVEKTFWHSPVRGMMER